MNNIKTWYDFILQQIAAESYLDDPVDLVTQLTDGNNRWDKPKTSFTRMTEVQANDFLAHYEIIDHLPNDLQSGFSATLMRNKDTGEYTLSFRSTEYRQTTDGGDFVRDAQGADVDFTQYGFAFAQIRDMEAYYAHLKLGESWNAETKQWEANASLDGFKAQFGGSTPAQNALNVTGYSLGAHLATVFTELHTAEIKQTTTFNGPGRGDFDTSQYTIQQIEDDFWAAANAPATHQLNGVDMQQAFPGATGYTYQDIYTRAVNAASGNLAFPTENIYTDPRYQWALIWTKATHGLKGTNDNASPGLTDLPPEVAAKITQLYGHGTHNDLEMAANSGVHADPTALFIEDQPNIEGFVGPLPVLPQAINDLLKKMGGDFGNTHSLALVADSLALMDALQPMGSLDERTLGALFAAGANERSVTWAAQMSAPNTTESHSLENILDGLRKLFDVKAKDANGDYTIAYGETGWATTADSKAGGFGTYANRETFYANLDALKTAIAGHPGLTLQALVLPDQFAANGEPLDGSVGYDANSIASAAKSADGLAWRYALQELNPFVLTGDNTLYNAYNQNGELNLYDATTGKGQTDQWIADRAAMLEHKVTLNTLDARYDTTASSQETNQGNTGIAVPQYDNENILYQDLGTQFRIARSGDGDNVNRTIFGSQGNDTSGLEGKAGDDHLYGLSGDDTLTGNGGADILEGGQGNDRLNGDGEAARISGTPGDDTLTGTRYDDTLAGHDGHDTYQLGLGQGADTIIEAAGQTSTLRLDPGITLANANAWQRGNDLAIVLDNGSDSLTIKGYYSSHPQSIGIEDALKQCGNLSHCGSLSGGIGLAANDSEWRKVA